MYQLCLMSSIIYTILNIIMYICMNMFSRSDPAAEHPGASTPTARSVAQQGRRRTGYMGQDTYNRSGMALHTYTAFFICPHVYNL